MAAIGLFAELQRRRVFRALVGYAIAAFAVLQIIEPVMHGLHWPDQVLSYVVVALAVGFPIVVTLAWIFDVRADGIERTPPSPAGLRGGALALVLAAIGVLAAAPGLGWYFLVRHINRPAPVETPQLAPSIAVLPFADLSPAKDQEFFSDGIAEEILNALAQVDGLRVAGRTSSFSFKGKGEDLRSIGQKLSVATVLEGSVRKEGNSVRITAQLIGTADGYHLWSKTFDRKMTGIFAIQDEIAKSIVEALKVKLLKAQGLREKRITSPEAYAFYLLGNELIRTNADRDPAIEAYEKALAIDPSYAPAWARLAYEVLASAAYPLRDAAEYVRRQRRAVEAAEKALALDANEPDAYLARAAVRSQYLWDWKGAMADIERSLALASGSVEFRTVHGNLLVQLGRTTEAIQELRKAIELDPLGRRNWWGLAIAYMARGEFASSRSALARARELSHNPSYLSHLTGDLYFMEGQMALAEEWWAKDASDLNRQIAGAMLADQHGRKEEALRLHRELETKIGASQPFSIALSYAWSENRDHAFEWLEKAYAMRDPNLSGIKLWPSLRPLHKDPRYAVLLKKMNLPVD